MIYNYEVKNPNADIEREYNAKIGLAYVSDYGYAMSPSEWSKNVEELNRTITSYNNWMFMGLSEWTITRLSENYDEYLDYNYFLSGDRFSIDYPDAKFTTLRPVFYLNSNVNLIGGTGTIVDPYRIN